MPPHGASSHIFRRSISPIFHRRKHNLELFGIRNVTPTRLEDGGLTYRGWSMNKK